MKTLVEPQHYNYNRFKASDYNFDHFTGPAVGESFIDVPLYSLDGKQVMLSDYLDKPLVLETGSLTCPMYAKCVSPMQQYAKQYPNMNFVVLYVREAHPGDKVGGQQSLEEKIANAQQTRAAYGEHRTIVVDDLGGEAHQRYGELPNMLYIIGTDGTVRFRSTWNNTEKLTTVLRAIEQEKPFELQDFKPNNPTPLKALRTLRYGGLLAIYDFVKELPRLLTMHQRAGNLKKLF